MCNCYLCSDCRGFLFFTAEQPYWRFQKVTPLMNYLFPPCDKLESSVCFPELSGPLWDQHSVSLTLASRGNLVVTSSCSEPQTKTGSPSSSPWPTLHAAQTQFIPLFPFLLGLGGLLSEVSKVETSIRTPWGWRLLIPMISSPSADPVPAGSMPTGRGSLGPQQTQLSIFLAWCKSGTFLPQHCAVHVNTLWLCGHLLPAPPSTDLHNVQHLDSLVWL